MNILYIHQYFSIPSESAATRSYWISRKLIERGHKVTVISATDGKKHKAGVEMIDGIEVHYVLNPYDNKMSVVEKLRAFAKFIFQAISEAKKMENVDLMYATSTPLTVGYIALRVKAAKKWPYVFEVRDLWPEFPIQIGAIKNKLAIRFLRTLERKIYEKSEHVVALSPGMQDGVVAAGTPIEKTSMIPNMSKPDDFFPHEPNQVTIDKFGLDMSKFKVVHFGSMGKANGLQYIVEAAKCCADKQANDIDFIFAGAGATEPNLKDMVKEYNLKNVKFLGYQDMYNMIEIVNCCDASITSFMNLPILKTNSPNKLFDSLSAGKPIIVNSAGWTKDLVEEGNCGFYVDPEKPEQLVDKLIEIKDNKELLRTWGENARKLSIEKYDRNILTSQVADVLENVFNNLKK